MAAFGDTGVGGSGAYGTSGMFDPGNFGSMQFGPQAQGPTAGYALANTGFQGYQQRKNTELQNAGNLATAQVAADAAKYGATVRAGEFNQLFPYLTSQYANLGKEFANAGGQSPPSPEISVGPIWNPQQIQQQVNKSRASTDATTANQQRQDQQSLAGRGFGGNSPLLQLLQSGRQMAGNQANQQAMSQIPYQAAQGNQQAILDSQKARESQFATRQQEDIARRAPIYAQQSSLLQALAGLI